MSKIEKLLLPVTTFALIDIKRLFRDKVAIFFVFVFPLMFLLVFGGLFGRDSDISFRIALLNESESAFGVDFTERAIDSEVLNVNESVVMMEEAREMMNRGELDAAIVLPGDFGEVKNSEFPSGQAIVYYDQNSQEAGQALSSILESMFQEINRQFVDVQMPFSVIAETTNTKGLTSFDYIFSGLLGFTILTLGIFGPTTVFPRLKQRGVLRRYHTTPLKVWQYFIGNVISNAFVGLLSVATMFIAARLIFGLNMRGDYISLIALVIFGVILMFGLGLALGGWAKNENQAAPLANLVMFPMMFLSGVFFPTFLMPVWLQDIVRYTPLTPLIESARLIISEGYTLFDLGPQLLVMFIWTVVIYIIAFKVFRWE